ncbi:MAG TPA: alpha/beta fold hydrolase [Bacteroidales bacterium]|nr:alpha/beta fold hydrolase [Bacteroidales bacterium]
MTNKARLLTGSILLMAIGLFCFNYYGARAIIQVRGDFVDFLRPVNAGLIPDTADFPLNYQDISCKTNDGLTLKGYIVRTDSINQKGTVFLVHGIRAYKEHFLPVARMLSDSGYNAVLIDLRAHGKSEGKYCTFGYLEKQDLTILIDTILNEKNLSSDIGIWGQSLGGAVALQTLAIDDRLKFGIIESSFSDFRITVHDYFKHFAGFDIPFLTDYLVHRAEKIGSSADQVVPEQSAVNIHQPVLIVHGNMDDRINITYGKRNYTNLSGPKEFIELPATHLDVWQVGGEDYFKRVFGFLETIQ